MFPESGRPERPLCRRWLVALLFFIPLCLQAEPLTFAWPAPAEARIIFEDNKSNREIKTEMRLRVTQEEEGEEGAKRRLDFPEVRLLEINGNDVTSAAEQAHLPATFRAMNQAVPSFIVDDQGKIVAIPGVEALLETIIETIPEEPPEVTHDQLRLVLFEPSIIELVRAQAYRFWHIWVELWLDKELPPGKRIEFEAESDYLGITVPAQGYFENLGPVEEQPGAYRLVFEMTARGERLREAVYKSLSGAYKQAGKPLPEEMTLASIKSAERRERVVIVTRLDTMRPYEVNALTSLSLDSTHQGPHVQIEEKVFRFEWSDQESAE